LTKPFMKAKLLEMVQDSDPSEGDKKEEATKSRSEIVILDQAIFKKYNIGRAPQRVRRSLSIFVAELREKLLGLEAVTSSRDADGLRRLAHSAHGSGGMVGAALLVHISGVIEVACDNKDDRAWEFVDAFQAALVKTTAAFERIIAQPAESEDVTPEKVA
jgi:HPt (histidine-containing phosphotransfer) domain-containing protein